MTEEAATLAAILRDHRERSEDLIEVLHHAQEAFGYISPKVQATIATALGISLNQVYGVVSFYNFFTLVPKGRHTIHICLGTACYVRGGNLIIAALQNQLGIEDGETTPDRRFSLEVVRCVGACALSPVVIVDEELHSHVNATQIPGILAKYP